MSYFLSPPIYLGRKPEHPLFDKLYFAVTSGLLEKMATNKNRVSRRAASSHSEVLATENNRFAILHEDGAEQSEDEDL